MTRLLPAAVALPLLILSALYQGSRSGRWEFTDDLDKAVDRLERMPLTLADWDGTEVDKNLSQDVRWTTGAFRTIRFVNRTDGQMVLVTLVCGRPGPLALHPPTICLPAAGYKQLGPEVHQAVAVSPSQSKADFWVATFSLDRHALVEHQRAFWSFRSDTGWLAPTQPRLELARQSSVYKVYVVRSLLRPDEPLKSDPAIDFIQLLLPELQKTVFES
jgi:hypothetical protein